MSSHLYVYVVDRDFGFAPNPFHGYCTLGTCKPLLRKRAKVNDWVMGVGGGRLKATGRCIYLMKVTEIMTFNDYWKDERFQKKKSLRNGSPVMMVGDNIYHQEADSDVWVQEDSHHSMYDGSPNPVNVKTDTTSANVLISEHFYYFGKSAPNVDLGLIGYENGRNYQKKSLEDNNVTHFIDLIEKDNVGNKNRILDDPFDFSRASKRVDQATGKIS